MKSYKKPLGITIALFPKAREMCVCMGTTPYLNARINAKMDVMN